MGLFVPVMHRPMSVSAVISIPAICAHLARKAAEFTFTSVAVLEHPLVIAPDGLPTTVVAFQVVATTKSRRSSQQPPQLFRRQRSVVRVKRRGHKCLYPYGPAIVKGDHVVATVAFSSAKGGVLVWLVHQNEPHAVICHLRQQLHAADRPARASSKVENLLLEGFGKSRSTDAVLHHEVLN